MILTRKGLPLPVVSTTTTTYNNIRLSIMSSNTSSTLRVLITGFGPYGNTKINPSLAVIHSLQKTPNNIKGVNIIAKEVSSEFFKCIEEAKSYIKEYNPHAVLMLGEYPGRSMITIERVAINYNDSTRYGLSDEAGYAPQGTSIVQDGPAAYFTTLPLRRIIRDLRASGIPSDISGDAGTLMCNHLMYGVLHEVVSNANTNGTDKNRSIPAGWIHLPALPEMAARESNLGMPSMTAELSCKAVECVIASIVASEKEGGLDIDVPIKSRLLV